MMVGGTKSSRNQCFTEVVWKSFVPAPPPMSPSRTAPLPKRQWRSRCMLSPQKRCGMVDKAIGFGLEVKPATVIWNGWEPGEEYTKSITLKNIQMKTMKIRYAVPTTKYFSTLFPQVIVLSAGTSFTLPLTFKPLEKTHYEDVIAFYASDGNFSILLQALLPEPNLVIPESLHFGHVAAHDSYEITFDIKNLSNELVTSYSWEVPDSFTILPPTGSIPPQGSCTLKAIFRPLSASVFESYAICCYGKENLQKKVKCEGTGKFPHLVISTSDNLMSDLHSIPVLDFKGVKMNETAVKPIFLQNHSDVQAPFKIHLSGFTPQIDKAFSCCVVEGIVSPNSKKKIPIHFNPSIVGEKSTDYFEVCPIGINSKSVVKCQGWCKGPLLKLSAALLNFGLVYSDKQAIKTIDIFNNSDCEAIFQVMLDLDTSVWHVSETSGIVQAGETRQLRVTFTPTHPINYYRRLPVLVHNQDPLFLDLIGTCHSLNCHPPLLKPVHLEKYQIHAARGVSFYSPEILFCLLEENKVKEDSNGCLYFTEVSDSTFDVHSDPPMTEYFDDFHNSDITNNPPHVSLDQLEIWLGKASLDRDGICPTKATVRVTNHTKGKMTAIWIKDHSRVFEVVPSVCDLPPLKTTDFQILFHPNSLNQCYGAQLECYAFYKSMRDFKLVNEATVTPPWCLTVSVSGHTFVEKKKTFLPQIEVGSHEITLPPTTGKVSCYKTLLLKNNGITPTMFQYNQKTAKDRKVFSIKPCSGMIKSKYHLSVCRLTPKKGQLYKTEVTVRLNDDETHDQLIKLVGTGEQPELFFSNNGEMYFRPTCIGTLNSNKYAVQNTGRLPVRFVWSLDSNDVNVEPKQGIILPNEIQQHIWTFSPSSVGRYSFEPMCFAWTQCMTSENFLYDSSVNGMRSKSSRKFVIRVHGEGCLSDLVAESSCIDFSAVICGSHATNSIVLQNPSNCDVRFHLSIDQTINSQYGEQPKENEVVALHLSKESGFLPARSRTKIDVIATPIKRALYIWSLYYEIINESGHPIEPNKRILFCELSADGVYPSLTVIDARTSGSGASVSKTQVWRWFCFDSLNSALQADPEKEELQYSAYTRQSTSRKPSIHTKSAVEFNFGAAPVDSESCFVSIMLKNVGAVVTEWGFLFPKDLQIPMDYWTETGIFDSDELHEVHIQDNKLFSVSPRNGRLNPGENQSIVLQYKHVIAGTHRIPVLLKVTNGREILLNFVGVTVEPSRRYLHFPGSKHSFTPVPIGGATPPKQLYEIYNGGSMAVMYEVNVAPLTELEDENFGHPILSCLNPQGEVLPGTCANIEFIFSPLEAKTYMVDIPIHIVGGDVALIAFLGIGYDQRKIGSNMPMLDQPPEFMGIPKLQSVSIPGQHVYLSHERLSFGNVPLFGRKRRIFFLANTSLSRPVLFSWHASSGTVNDVLRIEPVSGRLEPGERLLSKVTFCAAGQSSFYDLDLICEIVDEIKARQYHAELLHWEEEKVRQEVEFTIVEENSETQISPATKKSSPHFTYLENVLNKNQSPIRLTDSIASRKLQKSITKRYQTLPPVRYEDPLHLPSDRSRANRKNTSAVEDDEWPQPLPPEAVVCHLGITARTHDISEFRTNFSYDGRKNFIDRMLQLTQPSLSSTLSERYILTICDEEERDTVTLAMSKIVRSLLDDPTFHSSMQDIFEEDTPFFRQLVNEDSNVDEPHHDIYKKENGVDDTQKLMDRILQQDKIRRDRQILENAEVILSGDTTASSSAMTEKRPSWLSPFAYQINVIDEEIRRSTVFGNLIEEILSSTLSNVMNEAIHGEVVLTARPRLVALPPPSAPGQFHTLQTERACSTSSRNLSASKRRISCSQAGSTSSHSTPVSAGWS